LRKTVATALKVLFALAVSAAALWWAFSDVDLARLKENLAKTGFTSLSIYVLSQIVIQAVRVIRYGLLVRPFGNLSWRAVSASTCIGLPAAAFLPLRLGELVRPLSIARAGVPLPGALASVVVERVADGLFNVGLFFVLLFLLPVSAAIAPELRAVALVMLAGFGGGLVFLVAAYLARTRVLGLLDRIVGKVSPRFARKLTGLVSTFLDGLVAIGSWPKLMLFIALTLAYWGINGWSAYFLAQAYGIDIPFIAGWFAVSCVVFAVTVPAGPAFAGTLEAGYRLGLAPFGVSASDAALVAVVTHVVQLVLMALYVGIGFELTEPAPKEEAAA
jgi:glycosyltransferase 2 family protein